MKKLWHRRHEPSEKRHVNIRDEPDQEFRRASSVSDEEYARERLFSSEDERFSEEEVPQSRDDGTVIEGNE